MTRINPTAVRQPDSRRRSLDAGVPFSGFEAAAGVFRAEWVQDAAKPLD